MNFHSIEYLGMGRMLLLVIVASMSSACFSVMGELSKIKEDYSEKLLSAALDGNLETVKLLLDKGAKVDSKDELGQTALQLASSAGHLSVAKVLLDRGATAEGEALVNAALGGHTELVELLLDRGADVHYKRPSGWSALMSAASTGHMDIVKLLLHRGAEPEQMALLLTSVYDNSELESGLQPHITSVFK